jgi:hypothetical protein
MNYLNLSSFLNSHHLHLTHPPPLLHVVADGGDSVLLSTGVLAGPKSGLFYLKF